MQMARQSESKATDPAVPVLITRPRTEAEAFATALAARFGTRLRPIVAPLIAPRYLTPEVPVHPWAAVAFTSAHAVEGARRLSLPLPRQAWCVGRKTADVARAAGFQAQSADGTVDDLVSAILKAPQNGRILYLRGVDTRGNLLEKLQSSGVDTEVAIVYAQAPQPLSPQALDLLRRDAAVIVPLFSPRTALLFRTALPADLRANLHIATMSAAVAETLDGLPRRALAVARHPDAPGMLDAVESLLATLAPP